MAVAEDTGDFWSRRRAAVRAEAKAEAAAQQAVEEARLAADRARAEAEKTDEELLQDLGLPDPDMLKPGDDFAAFMQKQVPERLRRRALRKLWTSNPVLANLDGLLDYNDDFTDAATVLPDLRTAYEVGRGMYEHVRRLAAEQEADAEEAGEDAELTAPEDTAAAVPTLAEAADPAVPRLRETAEQEMPVEEMDDTDGAFAPVPLPRRHMRFAFGS